MGIHITKYKTKNGKTRKIKDAQTKGAASKHGATGPAPSADNKTSAGTPAKQGE